MDAALIERHLEYNRRLFAPEDAHLQRLSARAAAEGLPSIAVSADVGRLLSLMVHISGARRALEIGTLAGYSGTWIARALPADGHLLSLEVDAKHKRVAEAGFAEAGLGDRVTVRLGPALESLATLSPDEPWDFVFIDADKQSYPAYLEHARRLLRPGGVLTADNTLFYGDGRLLDESCQEPGIVGIRTFNRHLAEDEAFEALQIPLRSGVTVAWKR